MRITRQSGFSLIELLTVIAIIAMLAAIIFPVMSAAQARARQSQCTTNLNQLQQALKLYKNDNGRFPPVLSGYWENGASSMDSIRNGYLFREYVKAVKGFSCPDNPVTDMTAVKPDPLAGVAVTGLDRAAEPDGQNPAMLYVYDSYDGQVLRYDMNTLQPRYALGWADTPAEVLAMNNPDIPDAAAAQVAFMRQLKFRNPPDDTIITWCSYHRGGNQSAATAGMDLVLYLDGHVDRIPANKMEPQGCSWKYPHSVKPKP